MVITYRGHACFTLKSGGFTIAIDPYDEHVPGFRPLALKANEVYCSHGHGDHCYVQAVQIEKGGASPFIVTEISGFHDDAQGEKRGRNTMRIFEAEGLKVAHLGDIGCFPPEEDVEKLKGLDVCMVPVGGFYTIDAAQAKELTDLLQPRIVIPMHFRLGDLGLGAIAELDAFTSLYPAEAVSFTGTDTLELTQDSPKGVTVLQYQ
ncbi:MAG: MBL fold metallo-hydrolase [Firmicutes bacterium]|nr:MBL fold metallo-hydrolase [Bacillota bacterium]